MQTKSNETNSAHPCEPTNYNMSSSQEFLTSLAQSVYDSGALNNAFYDLWTTKRLSLDQIAILVRNYGQFVRAFPEVLSTMIMKTDDVIARTEHAKTLFSEMGYGNVRAVHSVLFDAFFAELGEKLGDRPRLSWATVSQAEALLTATTSLIEGEKELYSSDSATASGAQLALEWQAYTMLRKLYEGACLYAHLWERPDEFHEACEYFYVHIGAAEKEHKIESLNGAMQFDTDPASRDRIVDGFTRHLRLFQEFWSALAAKIMSQRA